nr:hypothetical protein [Tanacetum cinerariifolium]
MSNISDNKHSLDNSGNLKKAREINDNNRNVSDGLESLIKGEGGDAIENGISYEDVKNNERNDDEDRLDDVMMDKQSDVDDRVNKRYDDDCVNKQFANNECLDDVDHLDRDPAHGNNVTNDIRNKEGINVNEAMKDNVLVKQNSKDKGIDEEISNNSEKMSYASATRNAGWFKTNKLVCVPIVFTEVGNEMVIFNEELVDISSKN